MSKRDQLRGGVIGLHGHDIYAAALLDHPAVTPIAVAPATPELADRCREFAGEHRAELVGDPAALAALELDICAVLAPWRLQPGFVETLAAAGTHVLCEKPVAADLDGARRLARAVRDHGIRFSACYPLPKFAQSFRDAKFYVDDGHLGEAVFASFTYLQTHGPRYITETPHYRLADPASMAGGEMSMFGGYGVIALEWFTGAPIVEVRAQADVFFYDEYRRLNVEDLGLLSLRFANGAAGSLLLGRIPSQTEPPRIELEVTGTRGHIHVRAMSDTVTVFSDTARNDTPVDRTMWARLVDDFVLAVRDDHAPLVTLDDALRAQALLEAAYRSLQSGNAEAVARL